MAEDHESIVGTLEKILYNNAENGFIIGTFITEDPQDFFICGPSEMIDQSVEILLSLDVKRTSLHFEKWW